MDPCGKAFGCQACFLKSGCGYCRGTLPRTSPCITGDLYGPAWNDTGCQGGWAPPVPFSKTTQAMSLCGNPNPCSLFSLSGCSVCLAAPGCGWCSGTETCFQTNGTTQQPAEGACWAGWIPALPTPAPDAPPAPTPSPGAIQALCPARGACGAQSSCVSCTEEPGCAWCGVRATCMPKDMAASLCARRVVNETAACTDCSAARTCADCIVRPRCGWCGSSEKCLPGVNTGPVDAFFPTSCAPWLWGSSPSYDTCPTPSPIPTPSSSPQPVPSLSSSPLPSPSSGAVAASPLGNTGGNSGGGGNVAPSGAAAPAASTPVPTAVIVGSVLGALALVAIIAVAVVLYRSARGAAAARQLERMYGASSSSSSSSSSVEGFGERRRRGGGGGGGGGQGGGAYGGTAGAPLRHLLQPAWLSRANLTRVAGGARGIGNSSRRGAGGVKRGAAAAAAADVVGIEVAGAGGGEPVLLPLPPVSPSSVRLSRADAVAMALRRAAGVSGASTTATSAVVH